MATSTKEAPSLQLQLERLNKATEQRSKAKERRRQQRNNMGAGDNSQNNTHKSHKSRNRHGKPELLPIDKRPVAKADTEEADRSTRMRGVVLQNLQSAVVSRDVAAINAALVAAEPLQLKCELIEQAKVILLENQIHRPTTQALPVGSNSKARADGRCQKCGIVCFGPDGLTGHICLEDIVDGDSDDDGK